VFRGGKGGRVWTLLRREREREREREKKGGGRVSEERVDGREKVHRLGREREEGRNEDGVD